MARLGSPEHGLGRPTELLEVGDSTRSVSRDDDWRKCKIYTQFLYCSVILQNDDLLFQVLLMKQESFLPWLDLNYPVTAISRAVPEHLR